MSSFLWEAPPQHRTVWPIALFWFKTLSDYEISLLDTVNSDRLYLQRLQWEDKSLLTSWMDFSKHSSVVYYS